MIREFFEQRPDLLRADVGASGHAFERKPILRPAEVSEIAGAVLYFASDDSTYCTGTELVVDGGLHAGMYVDVPGMFSTSPPKTGDPGDG